MNRRGPIDGHTFPVKLQDLVMMGYRSYGHDKYILFSSEWDPGTNLGKLRHGSGDDLESVSCRQ